MKSAVDNLLRLASFTHEYLWNSSNLLHVTASFPFYCWVIICCMKVYLSYHSLSIHIWIVSAAKSLRSCLTLCDPMDSSPPGSPIPGILQARTLECVAISFSNAWKWKVKVKSLSRVRLFADPMDCSLPGSVHGIFQARVLEWGAVAFSVHYNTAIKLLKRQSCDIKYRCCFNTSYSRSNDNEVSFVKISATVLVWDICGFCRWQSQVLLTSLRFSA